MTALTTCTVEAVVATSTCPVCHPLVDKPVAVTYHPVGGVRCSCRPVMSQRFWCCAVLFGPQLQLLEVISVERINPATLLANFDECLKAAAAVTPD